MVLPGPDEPHAAKIIPAVMAYNARENCPPQIAFVMEHMTFGLIMWDQGLGGEGFGSSYFALSP